LFQKSLFFEENLIDVNYEFCAGNLVIDERRRFKIVNNSIVEIEPLVDWENLTYVGGKWILFITELSKT